MGALFTLPAAFQAAEGQSQAAQVSAAQLESNATVYEQAATDALLRGQREAEVQAMKGGLLRGEQRVALAASGVDLSSGTPADVIAAEAAMNALDVATLRANAAREAWGFKVQAAEKRAQAGLTRIAGRNQARSTILGGLASAFDEGISLGAMAV
jgi:hypothetical protein